MRLAKISNIYWLILRYMQNSSHWKWYVTDNSDILHTFITKWHSTSLLYENILLFMRLYDITLIYVLILAYAYRSEYFWWIGRNRCCILYDTAIGCYEPRRNWFVVNHKCEWYIQCFRRHFDHLFCFQNWDNLVKLWKNSKKLQNISITHNPSRWVPGFTMPVCFNRQIIDVASLGWIPLEISHITHIASPNLFLWTTATSSNILYWVGIYVTQPFNLETDVATITKWVPTH